MACVRIRLFKSLRPSTGLAEVEQDEANLNAGRENREKSLATSVLIQPHRIITLKDETILLDLLNNISH